MKRKYIWVYFLTLLAIIAVFLYQGSRTKTDFFQNGGFTRNYKNISYTLSDVKRPFWSFIKFGGEDHKGYYVFEKGTNRFQRISKQADSLELVAVDNARILQNQHEQYYISNDTLYNFDSKALMCRRYRLSEAGKPIDSLSFVSAAITPSVIKDGDILYKSLIPKKSNFSVNVAGRDGHAFSNRALFSNGITMADDGIIQPYKDGFIYVCMYRNEVRALDAHLKPTKVYHTIDTVKKSPEVIDLKDGRTTYKTQPTFANRAVFVKEDQLYIYSGIFADNDKGVSSFDTLVIDTYDLKKGFNYSHSMRFSMPKGTSSIPGSFILSDKGMIVLLLDGHILKYNFT
ncbi:hypothetical protein [Pedobacter rhodius]|uniref:DUF5050 domain-containing protein n=1 Tax=Pedobacter rhodius TaxID=3004098 RepID=A0ABT4KXE8_9SPHI|nr:hypothetical protein [Pedobacter sp. SJ11]MCZ4222917.1 hypothetical protein [Pedobacter sp. SJ11]